MDLPQLNEQQLGQVHEFFTSAAATLLFQRVEMEAMADWIGAQNTTEREQCWFKLQAALQLQAKLRDATADKRLTQRAQSARQAPVTTAYGPRN